MSMALVSGGAARGGAARAALAMAPVLAVVLVALPFEGRLAPAAGLAVFALVAFLVWDRIDANHPHARFGLANTVTLARAAATAAFAALACEPWLIAGRAGWAAAAAVAVVLALDGVDGTLARRQRLASAFGARFDMEVDALLILVHAALALGLGKAGAWVLGLGLMRYAFLLAGQVWPALRAELPPSLRRKAVCVLQIAALSLLLLPGVTPPASSVIAAPAFVALAWSFGLDIRWLLGDRR
jgi:phosphatidylglycerophosphate synthase